MHQPRSATCYLWPDSHVHVPFDLSCSSLFCMPARGKEAFVYVSEGRGAAPGTKGRKRAQDGEEEDSVLGRCTTMLDLNHGCGVLVCACVCACSPWRVVGGAWMQLSI